MEIGDRELALVRDEPHRLGWLMGKDRLGPLHSTMIRHVWDSFDEHRALQGHRGSYKTTAVLEVGSVRWLLFFPNDRIAILRKKHADAAAVVSTISKAMRVPEVQAVFEAAHGCVPEAVTDRYGEVTFSFKSTNTPEASVTALGLDSGYTGHHYDKVILDDFVTLKDRLSRAEREKTKEQVREVITNVLDPGRAAGFTGTPWARGDAWEVVPVEPLRYTVHDTGILTPEQVEMKRATTTPFLWAANYELRLDEEGDRLFSEPRYGKWLRCTGAQAHLDAAFDGGHTCALTILARRGEGFQGVGYAYPGNVKDWLGFVKSACQRFGVASLWMETNADKGYTADALAKLGVPVTPKTQYAESMNKHVKISTYLYEVWGSIEWDEDETDPEYLEQVVDYREGQEPDDAPDSAASLVRQAFKAGKRLEGIWAM